MLSPKRKSRWRRSNIGQRPVVKQELSQEDLDLISRLEAGGEKVRSLKECTNTYRKLLTSILFQFADSQLAAASAFAGAMQLAPSLDNRIELATITRDKLEMTRQTHGLLGELDLNLKKYFSSHDWESRVNRHAALGYVRASSDKRLNALMYPLEGWCDVAVFTYLMSAMTCIQLADFAESSFSPWAELASTILETEKVHCGYGLKFIDESWDSKEDTLELQASMNYWYHKVLECFGPENSDGNKLYRQFRIKSQRNEETRGRWYAYIQEELKPLEIMLPAARG